MSRPSQRGRPRSAGAWLDRHGPKLSGLLVGVGLLAAYLALGLDGASPLSGRTAGWAGRAGADLVGAVTHVRDGDTVEVAGTPVRLANLDCAERGTRAGDAATRRMRELVRGREVACHLSGRRSYDRGVGTCRLGADGQDLGRMMIGEGRCGRWR